MSGIPRRSRSSLTNKQVSDSEFTTECPDESSLDNGSGIEGFEKHARKVSYMTSLSSMRDASPASPEDVEHFAPGVSRGGPAEGRPQVTGRPQSKYSLTHIEPLQRSDTIGSIQMDSPGRVNEGFDGTIGSLQGRHLVEEEEDFEDNEIVAVEEPRLKSRLESARHVSFESDNTDKKEIIVAYWRQLAQGVKIHKKAPSKEEIKGYLDEMLMNAEVENKDKLKAEVYFVINHFRQRRCRHFCPRKEKFFDKTRKGLRKLGKFIGTAIDFCECGVDKANHTDVAIKEKCQEWEGKKDTEISYPWCFGDVDIPGQYNYLETPGGSRKYIRVDDLETNPRHLWEMLTTYWGFKEPNLIISLTGGDVKVLQGRPKLYRKFRDGLMKATVKTRAWILTEGLHDGVSKEVGDIFQEDLKRSEYAELEDHSNIPLIGFSPWGILADKYQLLGIHVGTDDAKYTQQTVDRLQPSSGIPNALDPYHVAYVLTDDGTAGQYKHESILRRKFEKYIKTKTSLSMLGASDVKTPLVILVVGGDIFTLEKVAVATRDKIPVVVVNGSGDYADLLTDLFRGLEHIFPRAADDSAGWEPQEEQHFTAFVSTQRHVETVLQETDIDYLREIMKSRHLLEIFGHAAADMRDLDKAILHAIFEGIHDISAQLYLTLALDRADIAKENIFIESRKHELKGRAQLLEQALLLGRAEFVDLLLDHDIGGELNDFDKFLTIRRLYRLHEQNLSINTVQGKLLRSFCKRNIYGDYVLGGSQLLPQMGRVIHKLMGHHYRLLYQEREYRQVNDSTFPQRLSTHKNEEAVWHLFLWAVLANKRDIAELFLFETSCKIGAALVAFKMFTSLAEAAETLAEVELTEELKSHAQYFENLAECTLDHLYEFNRDEAYTCLVSTLPLHWGKYVTPLSIAEDAGAMTFMGHACVQTFLNRVWMHYMDQDTSMWKLFPLFAFLPFLNIPFIVFDKRNLAFGQYRQQLLDDRDYVEAVDTDVSTTTSRWDKVHSSNSSRKHSVSRERRHSGRRSDGESDVSDEESDEMDKVTSAKGTPDDMLGGWARRLRFGWWCVRMYYTAPVNKFIFYMVSYLVFLGIFAHFLLTVLRPIADSSEISGWEWFVMIYVGCLTVEELIQLFGRKCSGPLHNLRWQDLHPEWNQTWHFKEKLSFVLNFHKISLWLSDRWNSIDAIMLSVFYTSVALRFTVGERHFGVVRTFYAGSLIIFFFRLLRIGYILQDIGPRIVTIKAMMKDLFQFMFIMAVFIISFGIAFQALLDPNKPVSWSLFVDILWRPYWQMYGEMYLDDVTEEMGRPVQTPKNCTYILSNVDLPYCYDWVIPLLLGIYMLITNILLLNLLIAIFSHSFDIIEKEAIAVWRYHMYDLVHEYYHQAWLPPPLNLLCHLTNLTVWLLTWPQRWCFTYRRNKHTESIRKKAHLPCLFAAESQQGYNAGYIEHQAEEAMQDDNCYCLWSKELVTRARTEVTNHFLQHEYMRNEDLEEKAYKRYLRSQKKNWQEKVSKSLDSNSKRLAELTSDVQDLKKESMKGGPLVARVANDSVDDHDSRMDQYDKRLAKLAVGLRELPVLKSRVETMGEHMKTLVSELAKLNENLSERKSHRRKDSKHAEKGGGDQDRPALQVRRLTLESVGESKS